MNETIISVLIGIALGCLISMAFGLQKIIRLLEEMIADFHKGDK